MRSAVTIVLIMFAALSALQAQTPAVDIILTVTDGISGGQQLHFGLDPAATNGIDASLGEAQLAPVPASGVFDARLIGDDVGVSLGSGTLKDYRQGNASTVAIKFYEIRYQVGAGTNIVVNWNLPTGVTGRLQDVLAGTYIDQAMSGSGTYTVTSPSVFSKLKMTIGYGVAAPPVPTLATPADGATDIVTSPYVSWAPSSGATSYHLQVSTDQAFVAIAFDQNNIAATVYQVTGLQKSTLYYWRVSASNGFTSAYSSSWKFSTVGVLPDIPVLLLPADFAVNVPINTNVSWSPSAGATSYRVQVATDPAFGSMILDNSGVVATAFQLGPLLNSTTYYWRVGAINSVGASELTPTRTFTTIPAATAPQAPVPNSPADGQKNVPTSLTLNWNPTVGATSYRVQVSTSSTFLAPILDDTSVFATSRQVRSLANSAIYYWRVRAKNEAGPGNYSSTMRFTTIDPGVGLLWQQTGGPSGGTVQCIAASGTTLFAGMNGFGGISRSTDNGTSWTSVNTGLGTTDVRAIAVSGTNLFAGTYLGGVFMSTNNGANWRDANTGLANPIVVSVVANGSSVFAGTYGGVFLSTNNGTSWTGVNSGLTDKFVNCFLVSGTSLFAGSNGAGVYVTTNNGSTWTGVGPANSIVLSLAASGTNLYAGTSTGVYRSTDNGSTWNAAGLASSQVLSLASAGTILLAGTNGSGMSASTNFGTTWTSVNNGLTDRTVRSLAVIGTNLFAGTNSAVFVSQVPGLPGVPALDQPADNAQNIPGFVTLSWNNVATARSYHLQLSLNSNFTSLVVDDSALTSTSRTVGLLFGGTMYYWRVRTGNEVGSSSFTSTRQFTTMPSTSVDGSGSGLDVPRVFALSQNYPNPFNPSTAIDFAVPKAAVVSLEVFNVLGQRVALLMNERKEPGFYHVTWNAGVTSGMYFLRLQAGAFVETKKMVLLK